MSNKGIIVALVVLVALVGAMMALNDDRGKTSGLGDAATAGFAAFLDTNAKDVEGLEIAQGDTSVKVAKKGSDWVLESSYGYAADGERVDTFLEEIKKVNSGRIRARKEASHSNFEVDKEKGVRVTFLGSGGKKLSSMVMGKNSQGRTLASKSFVRFDDEPEVFEVEGNARSRVGGGTELDKDYFLNKDIFKLEDDREIYEATLTRGEEKIILERRWVSAPKASADDKKDDAAAEGENKEPELEWKEHFFVASGSKSFRAEEKEWSGKTYVNNNNNLRADDAVKPGDLKEYGLDAPQLRVALKHRIKGVHTNPQAKTDDKVLSVLFGNAMKDDKGEDSKYYAMVDGESRVFAVSKYTFDRFNKQVKDFEPTPEEPKEEAKPAAAEPVKPDPGQPGTLEGGLIEPATLDDEPAEETSAAPVPPTPTPTPAPTQVRASHILIPYKGASRAPTVVTRTKDEARTEAARILAEIQKDNSKFEELAKAHSSCPSSSSGGDLGSFGRGRMAKPFEETSFSLEPGGISGVVETSFGFHIIKRTE